jgi:hypothetical protein
MAKNQSLLMYQFGEVNSRRIVGIEGIESFARVGGR